MPLLENINHFISLTDAKAMTARFRTNKETILKTEYQGQNILSNCETFNREAFDAIVEEEGCVGVRVYFGMDPNLKVRVIVVGVDENNDDILPAEDVQLRGGDDDRKIVEVGRPCPDFCPDDPL